MQRPNGLCMSILLLLSQTGYTYTQDNTANYWQCNSYDQSSTTWTGSNTYQKVAMSTALELCKKESKTPATCKVDHRLCVEYNQDKNSRPRWQCTALDQKGTPWLGNYFNDRDSAAMNALDICKSSSKIPDTCTINLVTCFITVEGEKTQ